jgi:hypothetical protein
VNPILTALRGWRLFIVYQLRPRAAGGMDKVPVDPVTLRNSDAQDSATWLMPEDAHAHVERLGSGYGVGLMIVPPFFVVDIDHALQPNGQWSPLAHELCARFRGAAVEVSAGREGLHIFGRYSGTMPPHKKKNTALGIECYTEWRFIALTGYDAVGDITSDHTEALLWTLAEYFPGNPEPLESDWTEAPREEWSGPADDDELIQLARDFRQSAAATFGSRASFSALFDRNVDALAKAFPPQTPGQDFDGSSADQALANHLAFFTGADCERMARIMERSALKRDKWERVDYFRGTVLKAARETKKVYQTREPAPAAPTPSPLAVPSAPTGDAAPTDMLGQYLTGAQQWALFGDCIYIADVHAALMPDGRVLTPERFSVHFGGYDFAMTIDGQKPTRDAWEAFTKSQIERFPKAAGLVFDPRRPPRERIEREGLVFVNSWVPVDIIRTPGDPAPFIRHLCLMFPDPWDQLVALSYFAFIAQYFGEKSQWALFLQGVEGNGKTFFSTVLQYCVGERYTHNAKASELDSRFNAALDGKLLICVEDVFISEAKNSMWETLKPMITNRRLEIEGKGVEKVTRDTCFNFVLNSNHRDALRKTANERRIAPLFAAQQSVADMKRDGMDEAYFARLYNWARAGGYAIIAHYLHTFPIPDELNPAKLAQRAPQTSSTQAAIAASQGSVEQEGAEAIAELLRSPDCPLEVLKLDWNNIRLG